MQPDPTHRATTADDAAQVRRWPGTLVAVAVLAAVGVVVAVGAGVILAAQGDSGPAPTARVGASSDGYAVWARNDDGQPVRWDPCRPIVLVADPSGAPPGAIHDLRAAVDRLRAVTGLDLVVAGDVTERPAADRAAHQPTRYGDGWAPVLVAWAGPGEGGLPLRSFDRGVAIPVAAGPDGDRTFVTGQVVLNADRPDLSRGFADRRDAWGSTILHELMHLLGLDHVDDRDELMWTFPGDGPVAFGPGDLAGLHAVGADGGCRPVPPARDVEVVLRPIG